MFLIMLLAFIVGLVLLVYCVIQIKNHNRGIAILTGILGIVLMIVSIMLALPH